MLKRVLPILPVLVLFACAPDISNPDVQAAVINSLTATSWTPTPITPSATPQPNTAKIVDILNEAIVGSDPLSETIAAKYRVLDAHVLMDAITQQATTLRIHVDCDWVYSDGCTPETTFVVLMYAFSENDKIIERIQNQIPASVQTLELVAFERMSPTSNIFIAWKDVWDFAQGKINGNQLGARMMRSVGMP
ncbi:MAG: hypothetical protein KF758_00375 [Anaerolineales bacterium]|nr:hypothetical protein [Anaerolineales bacterium]MBX3035339.1 hypothetical protein [Anaerolineales bacterium]